MGRCLAKLAEDEYVEWGTVVDAPISWVMNRDGVEQHIRRKYGEEGLAGLDARLERCEERGHSALWGSAGEGIADLILGNRAGDNESELTLDQLREHYREQTDDQLEEGAP